MMRRLSIFVLGAIVLGGWAFAQDTGERELRPRRLYFGSPPATPHAITRAMTNCLSCHGESATFAPKSPHPTRVQCRQCHVEGVNASPPFRNSSLWVCAAGCQWGFQRVGTADGAYRIASRNLLDVSLPRSAARSRLYAASGKAGVSDMPFPVVGG